MPHPVTMPKLGQDMEEGIVTEWLKSEGDVVADGELLARIETDKADVDFEAPVSGYLIAIVLEPGEVAATGTTIAWISEDPSDAPPAAEQPERHQPDKENAESHIPQQSSPALEASRSSRIISSPLARRRASTLSIDIDTVEGTGPGGRITENDVLREHQGDSKSSVASQPGLSSMRAAVAAQMLRSTSVPQFRLMREVVLDGIEERRADSQASYMDLILWVTAQALKQHEAVNSSWVDDEPPRIEVYPSVNLGFAVAVADGLIVPVIRDAANLSLAEIANDRRRLEAAVHSGELRGNDLEGATFTVSNLGSAGVDEFTALVNPPEAGILAVGAVKPRPVARNGVPVVAPTVRLTLAGDHRVFDGLEGARFLTTLAGLLGATEGTTTGEEQ